MGQVIGAVLMAGATVQEGRLAEAQGKAERKFAEFNARMQEREAKSKMDAASIEEQRISKKARAIAGSQKAKMAAAGLDVSTGTALDVFAETARESYVDRSLTLRKGMIQKVNLEAQAAATRAQGKLAEKMGKAQKKVAYMKAAGQLAMGFSSLGGTQQAGTTANQQAAFSAGKGPMSASGANQWASSQWTYDKMLSSAFSYGV